jgi:hypothetical protein
VGPGTGRLVREVHQRVDQSDEQDEALQHRVVTQPDGLVEVLAHAVDGEDRLGEHGAGQQQPELQPDGGDDRQQRVAHDVAVVDHPRGQPLGLGGAHVVLVHHLGDSGPGDADDDRQRDGPERHRG